MPNDPINRDHESDKSQITEAEARFNRIIVEYGTHLRNAIARVCPRDLGIQLDDVEQEARLRLWNGIKAEREIQDFSSYIYRVAVTTTIDAIRQARSRREKQLHAPGEETGDASFSRLVAGNPGPDRVAEGRIVLEKVEGILGSFDPDRRRAVGLLLQGMNTTEIGNLMQWSEPKARNLVYRGLHELRKRLRAQGIDYEIE
jgi:RNA polymerase sigma factor (sigma-70 family)